MNLVKVALLLLMPSIAWSHPEYALGFWVCSGQVENQPYNWSMVTIGKGVCQSPSANFFGKIKKIDSAKREFPQFSHSKRERLELLSVAREDGLVKLEMQSRDNESVTLTIEKSPSPTCELTQYLNPLIDVEKAKQGHSAELLRNGNALKGCCTWAGKDMGHEFGTEILIPWQSEKAREKACAKDEGN